MANLYDYFLWPIQVTGLAWATVIAPKQTAHRAIRDAVVVISLSALSLASVLVAVSLISDYLICSDQVWDLVNSC